MTTAGRCAYGFLLTFSLTARLGVYTAAATDLFCGMHLFHTLLLLRTRCDSSSKNTTVDGIECHAWDLTQLEVALQAPGLRQNRVWFVCISGSVSIVRLPAVCANSLVHGRPAPHHDCPLLRHMCVASSCGLACGMCIAMV